MDRRRNLLQDSTQNGYCGVGLCHVSEQLLYQTLNRELSISQRARTYPIWGIQKGSEEALVPCGLCLEVLEPGAPFGNCVGISALAQNVRVLVQELKVFKQLESLLPEIGRAHV